MAKIKNISGEDLIVPALGGRLVLAGQEVDVPDGDVYGFTCQEHTWAPVGEDGQAAHDEGRAAERERIEAERGPEAVAALEPPAGNASTEAWREWVVTAGRATPDDVADLGRDEIRSTYGPQEG